MNLRHEKFQFLGIHGIFTETIKLIQARTTIFSQIALAFIFPLLLTIFAHSQIPKPHQWSIHIHIACFFSSAVLFLLSTGAAVYAAACVYSDRDVSFGQLIRAAPKLCKQHLLTLLCLITDLFAFNFVALYPIILISIAISVLLEYDPIEFLTQFPTLLLLAEGWYFALIWQLASVVSVFEPDSYGFEAIARSKELLAGKMAVAVIVLALIGFPGGVIFLVIRRLDVESGAVGVGVGGVLGIIWMVLFLMFLLIGTVLYFVGKSHHREKIDKSALADHIGSYLPVDREALKDEDEGELVKSPV